MIDKLKDAALMAILGLTFTIGGLSMIATLFVIIFMALSSSLFMLAALAAVLGNAGVPSAVMVVAAIIAIAAIAAFRLVRILGPKHIGESEQLDACQWNVPGLAWNRALSDSENLKALRKGFERHNKVVLHAYAWEGFHADAKGYYSKKKVVAAAIGSQS